MTRLQQAAIGLTPLLLAATFAAPVSSAPNPDRIGPALHRIAQDRYTSSDLALIRQHPKLAAKVPDPTQTPVLHARTGPSRSHDTTAARTLGTCGHWVDVWFRKRSLLGDTLYKWHHRVVYCRTARRVMHWQNRYDYLTAASSIVQVRERTTNQQGGIGTSAAWSHLQRQLEFCVIKYGCYASLYPWSRITVYGAGGYDYTGDNG
jgi:hypothetical protein